MKLNWKTVVIVVVLSLCATAIVCYALSQGIDGLMVTGVVGGFLTISAGLCGVKLGRNQIVKALKALAEEDKKPNG